MRLRTFWILAGLALVALIVWGSLAPVAVEMAFRWQDKFEHLLAYAVLAFWWLRLATSVSARWLTVATCALLGVVMEVLQGFTGYRLFDGFDALANASGAMLALGLGRMAWLRPLDARLQET